MPPAVVALVGATFAASAAYSAGIVIFSTTLIEAGWLAAGVAFAAVAAVGFATMAMTPKPPKPNIPNFADTAVDRTRMIRQPITARRMVYGWMRVSGPQTFLHTTSDNDLLHVVLTLTTHRVSRLDALLLNDEVVPLDANGDATGTYAGNVSAWLGLGTTAGDSTFHSELTAAVGATKWSGTHLQTGCAKLYIQLKWDADKFKGGSLPNISVIVRGKDNILDSRDASTGWTDNAALCIADWLKNEFGYNWPAANIDDTALQAAANVCDEIQARNPGYTFTAAADTDLLTCSIDIPTGWAIYATTTTTLPGGMSLNTAYYWIRQSATTGKIATSKADALAGTSIDIIDAGTGTHTLRGVTTFTAATTDIITVGDTIQKLRTGTRVNVVSSDTLPTGLSAGTDYYWIGITSTTGKVATSLANSRAGTAVDITDAGTGTHLIFATGEPRYTLNGTIDTSQDAEDLLKKLLSAMAGSRVTSGKTITLYAGAWRAPTVTITEEDLAGSVSIQTRNSRRDLFNGVKGVFSSPDDLWQPTDFPPVQVAAYVTQDQETELWRDADLSYTNSPTMAMRIARIDLERNRRQISGSWPCKLTAMRILGFDIINVDHTRFGWDAKTFEVGSWKFVIRSGSEGPTLGCDLQIKEIDANVYAWTPGTDEAVMQPAQTTTLPDPFTVAAPTSLVLASGTNELFLREDGTVFTRIKATWTAPADSFVTSGGQIEIQWKRSTDADVAANWETGPNVTGSATVNWILDVEDGVSYDVRVRSVNVLGVKSAYTTVTGHTVIGKTTKPEDVTTFTAQQNGVTVVFKWSQVTDIDLSGYEIRFMKAPFVWEDATTLTSVTRGTQVTSAAVPPSPTESGVQVAWVFGIKARDTSENYSASAKTFSTVIVNVFDVISENEQRPLWIDWETNRSIAGVSYASKSFSVSSQNSEVIDLRFSGDGTKAYILGQNNKIIYQYGLNTSGDISTASYQGVSYTLPVGALDTLGGFFIKPDGTKFYVTNNVAQKIYQFSISSAWQISTATLDNTSFTTSAEISDGQIGISLKLDGTKLYVSGIPTAGLPKRLFQYSVASAWQISTASYDGVSFLSPQTTQTRNHHFYRDGRRLFILGDTPFSVYQYHLSVPWDLSLVDYDATQFNPSSQDTQPLAFRLSEDMQIAYVLGNTNDKIYQYKNEGGFYRNPITGNLNPLSTITASGNDFNVFNSYVYSPVSQAIYEAPEIDLGTDLSARIWADIAANLGPVSSGSANYQLQIDYKTSIGSYDGFENWTVGDVGSLQYVKARIVSEMSSGTDITRLTGFNPTIDAEEREEHAETVTINSGGSTVNFTKNFALVPAVGIWNAEASAKVPGLGTVTTSGFVGHVFSASGTNIGGTVNWRAVGV